MICVSQYETIDKKPYIIYQKLKGPNVSWGASIDAIESPAEIKITSDLKMYLSHSNDGDIYAIGFTDYYLIKIASPVLSSNELRSILRKMYIIE